MVTVDPPFGVLTLPKLSEIWRAVTLHPPVAITALICATVAFCFLVWSLGKVADASGVAFAVSTVVGAVAGAVAGWVKARGKGKAKG